MEQFDQRELVEVQTSVGEVRIVVHDALEEGQAVDVTHQLGNAVLGQDLQFDSFGFAGEGLNLLDWFLGESGLPDCDGEGCNRGSG